MIDGEMISGIENHCRLTLVNTLKLMQTEGATARRQKESYCLVLLMKKNWAVDKEVFEETEFYH